MSRCVCLLVCLFVYHPLATKERVEKFFTLPLEKKIQGTLDALL